MSATKLISKKANGMRYFKYFPQLNIKCQEDCIKEELRM